MIFPFASIGIRVDDVAACPLCRSADVRPFARAHGRRYFGCDVCGLVFMAPADRPDAAAERAHYATHENDPAEAGYRAFLARLAAPLAERLPPGAHGLDYGSGPGPALAMMLRERGFAVEIYDPFFAPDASVLARSYDFVTCTETAEHFFSPADEFSRLNAMLRPGGWLGVMTEVLDDGRAFGEWRYARDPTHVCFYRPRTLEWIAARHGWALERPHRNVALFRKPPKLEGGGPA
jgi:Methyltransferase domain